MSITAPFLPSDFEMKMRIAAAIDAPIDQLSVLDICKKAEISRQTFYNHFESKYDVAPWFCRVYEERFLNEIGRTLSWRDGLVGHFEAIANGRSLLSFTTRSRWESEEIERKRRQRAIVLVATAREYRDTRVDDALLFCVRAYTHIEERMAGEWFADGMREPKAFALLLEECVPRRLHQALAI